jgi:nucleoid-associated protein YgaU
MGISRYTFNGVVKSGKTISASTKMSQIFNAVELGAISYSTYVLEESQRLDHIAGVSYQDSSYWWVIAAASGIGWGMQVPPGTVLRIPRNIGDVLGLIS